MIDSAYLAESIIESAVGLLIVKDSNRANAMTISYFSEVAHHPTTLWISVAKQAYTNDLIRNTGRFSLAILNLDQKALALACGTVSGRHDDKCSSLDLYPGPQGFLFLRGALACTACEVRRSHDIHDHTLFIADIIETQVDSRAARVRHLLTSDLKSQ